MLNVFFKDSMNKSYSAGFFFIYVDVDLGNDGHV